MGLMLPGRTGEEIISLIRNKSQTPIVAISGKTHIEDKVKVFELGADDYITKK